MFLARVGLGVDYFTYPNQLYSSIAVGNAERFGTDFSQRFFLISYFQRLNDELNIAMVKLIKVVFKIAGGISCVYLSLN